MKMRTARRMLGFTLMFVVFAAASVSAQDVKSLAGKWVGIASPTSGSNVPLEVEVKPDGSYTSKWGSTMGKGVIKKDGDKLTAEGNLITGTGTAAAGTGKSDSLTVTSKDGKPERISGTGTRLSRPCQFPTDEAVIASADAMRAAGGLRRPPCWRFLARREPSHSRSRAASRTRP